MQRILKAFRRGGWRLAARTIADRGADFWAERRLGIWSAGLIPIESLIPSWKDCHDYFPTTVSSFRTLMSKIEIRPAEDVFVDFGSGKGRVLALASQYPFRRVIGVEVSETLCEVARRNLTSCRIAGKCSAIEIWRGGAADYPVPPDASIFYFFNPFRGAILRTVLESIYRSLTEHPRDIWIVFNNPVHFVRIEGEFPWIERVHLLHLEHDCLILRNSNPLRPAMRG